MNRPFLATFILLITVIGFPMGNGTAQAESPDDIVVIANRSLQANSISPADLKRIFLKERGDLNGERITPINARTGSALRREFVQKALQMTPAEENNYWEDQKIRTGTHKPTELSDTVKAVFSVRNGISYAYRKDVNPAVAKILLTL